MDFEQTCEEAKRIAFSFKNPLIVHHYDSVTGDNEVLYELNGKLRKSTISKLYKKLKSEFGSVIRSDGKEIIKPRKLRLFSLEGSNIRLVRVKTFLSHETNKSIIGIRTEFSEVKLTNDHSLISLKDDQIAPVKPSQASFVCSPLKFSNPGEIPVIDLEKSKLLLNSKAISTSKDKKYFFVKNKRKELKVPIKIKLDETLMTFFGLWVADGCFMYQKGSEGVRISSYKDKETKRVIDSVLSFFGSSIVPTDKGITAVVCNKTLFKFMRFLGFIDGSKRKHAPSWIFGTKKNLIAAFLRGYFSGDGTVSKGDVNAMTISRQLKKDIMSLLLFFGIRSRQRRDGNGWKISINGKEYKKIFVNEIGFLQRYKNKKIILGRSDKSNLKNYLPISRELLTEVRPFLPKIFRDRILAMFKNNSYPTKFFIKQMLTYKIPKKIRETITDLIEKDVYFEPILVRSEYKSNCVVYDFETESGNFVCENLVLKNTDGISSGSIVISAFRKEFKNHRHRWIKKLDDNTLESLEKEDEIIFVDLGSGNERVNELKDVLIIDHHQPKKIGKPQVNPLLHGIDGGSELSSSGTAYLIFRNNVDLAIVGAVGDMQYPLIGKNREILEQGVKNNQITLENDLRLYGRSSRTLPQFLAYSDDVYLPGITYNESNAVKFLGDIGISPKNEKWGYYTDLDKDQKSLLKKSLIEFLISKNFENRAKNLIGEVYLLNKRPLRSDLYDASEFSTILNACGRHGKADVGVGVCLGDAESYKQSLELLKYHKTKIREGVLYAKENIQDLGSFYFIDAIGVIDEGIIGIVCGMVFTQFEKKPILGASLGEKDTIKISTRGNNYLMKKGLNLGKILSAASEKVGGVGGGHNIAAGASIPKTELDGFLLYFGNQLRQSS